jgi:hypothetical protein
LQDRCGQECPRASTRRVGKPGVRLRGVRFIIQIPHLGNAKAT